MAGRRRVGSYECRFPAEPSGEIEYQCWRGYPSGAGSENQWRGVGVEEDMELGFSGMIGESRRGSGWFMQSTAEPI